MINRRQTLSDLRGCEPIRSA